LVKVETFIVDIFFRSGTKLLNVEINQFALDFYSALPASERPVIVFDQEAPEEDPFTGEPVPDPLDEIEKPPEDIIPTDQDIPTDAITIVIPNSSYSPSPTPSLGRIYELPVIIRRVQWLSLFNRPSSQPNGSFSLPMPFLNLRLRLRSSNHL